jgi:hypothetical protein
MTDNEVGYGKPPKHSQFRKGASGNPNGRRKRGNFEIADTMTSIMETRLEFRDRGRIKKATRGELTVRKLITSAVGGKAQSAAAVLKLRASVLLHGDIGITTITIRGGLPHSDETIAKMNAEQKILYK